MSRRARAAGFTLAAIACAAIAASLASGYRDSVAEQYGPLRPVVVATRELPGGQILGPAELKQMTAVRRIPARFVPHGALGRPADAIGRAPVATIPVGAHLLDSQLQVPVPEGRPVKALAGDRRPVQIAVTGAEALAIDGPPEGKLVDVVISEGPDGPGSRGRTYVAATEVRLLALGGAGPDGGSRATLALDREQALALIEAEASARQIRLLPRG